MKKLKKFNKELSSIKYGWYDKEGKLHESLREGNFVKNYRMQSVNEVMNNTNSICWDLCEVEREFFKKTVYPFVTIFAVLKTQKKKPCHTFLVFKDNDCFYWFEASWNKMKGIRKYSNFDDILDDVRNNFYEFTKSKDYDKNEIEFYVYKKPINRISCNMFYFHCMYLGKKISSNYNRLFK